MTSIKRTRSPALSATLGILGVISLAGLAYCVLAIAGIQQCDLETCTLVMYGAYFVISSISIVAIYRWKQWGINAMAAATFSVGVVNLVLGTFIMWPSMIWLLFVAAGIIILQGTWNKLE